VAGATVFVSLIIRLKPVKQADVPDHCWVKSFQSPESGVITQHLADRYHARTEAKGSLIIHSHLTWRAEQLLSGFQSDSFNLSDLFVA